MNPLAVTPSIEHLVSLARAGAEKAEQQASDSDEFNEVANFIGRQLQAGQKAGLGELTARLRQEDRRALAWYLTIVRTLSGTVPADDAFHHLIFIPVHVAASAPLRLALGRAVEEISGALEHALDLGNGSLELSSELVSLTTLESVDPLDWHDIAKGAQGFLSESLGVEELGAIVGRWTVAASDRARLSRKLTHALQRTPTLMAWRMRTESLLEEQTPEAQVRIYPAVLLQDLFALSRQLRLNTQLEQAARLCSQARSLSWRWSESSGELTWHLSEGRVHLSGTAAFPDEPVDLVEAQLVRLAQRLQLKLSPPLP